MSRELFEGMLKEADIPISEADMETRWKQINEAQGSLITNDSKWSPFWRLILAIVTTPCKWLVDLLVITALPNLFMKYASGQWLDVLVWAVNIKRKPETKAVGSIPFTRETSAGEITVPAGTVIESPKLDGYIYRVIVTADTTIPDGMLVASVPVEAEKPGSAYNLGPGYYSILPAPIPGIVAVSNTADWLETPGADEEKDEELRLRGRNQFSAVGQYHHDAAYKAVISEYAGIRTDYLFFEHNAPRGPGTANCFIMQETGAPPQEWVDDINQHIRDKGNHGHGDDMVCYPMPETPHDLTVTVFPKPNLSEDRIAALKKDVEDRVRCAFRENTIFTMTKTMPHSRFSLSQLDKDLHAMPDLLSVEFNRTTDIVSTMDLPVLGTLLVQLG
ncbi:Baseplate J family protein [Pseudodesulfovibrio profundus]|uniref:Baseplate J family protein n=1 Tax=Pseudodesulfovibrio profundus TaxID=57320 RepID=A0A2C8FF54_9BACT|nr:baseplate J/gp47 family protein [Pseudodesulfovibrio profundus]SOB60528.1 Baseplate J family protein [Pseudodesulfovibrio profundus]